MPTGAKQQRPCEEPRHSGCQRATPATSCASAVQLLPLLRSLRVPEARHSHLSAELACSLAAQRGLGESMGDRTYDQRTHLPSLPGGQPDLLCALHKDAAPASHAAPSHVSPISPLPPPLPPLLTFPARGVSGFGSSSSSSSLCLRHQRWLLSPSSGKAAGLMKRLTLPGVPKSNGFASPYGLVRRSLVVLLVTISEMWYASRLPKNAEARPV
mmetsp:Transcript_150695/g.383202  ORF Transcript_150695/g.383202 Transcript_150695/m.383202 type:complete len:213 (+) Transcript_150695:865-1503(+)